MKLEIPQHVMFKLQAWRDMGSTEVTGFFVTEKNEITKVIDAVIIKSKCTGATVDIDAEDIEKLYMDMSEKEIYPDQLQIWWHTHPGSSASPSGTDQTTFSELGKDRGLNIMYILAKGGEEFAQASITHLPTGIMMKSEIKIEHPFTEWNTFPSYKDLKKDYDDNVITTSYSYGWNQNQSVIDFRGYGNTYELPYENQYSYQTPAQKKTQKETEEKRENIIKLLTQEEQDYLTDLHSEVSSGKITPDDADMMAYHDAIGEAFGFYTGIYSDDGIIETQQELFEEYDTVGGQDTGQILIDDVWAKTTTYEDFKSAAKDLVRSDKVTEEELNFWLEINNQDFKFELGKFIPIEERKRSWR